MIEPIIFCVIIILLMIAIYIAFSAVKKQRTSKLLSQVSANQQDPISVQLANSINVDDLSVADRIRFANMYINNMGDIDQGQEMNNQILNDIISFAIDIPDELTDLFEIRDLIGETYYVSFNDFGLVEQANGRIDNLSSAAVKKLADSTHVALKTDEEAVQKTLIETQRWVSDAENVQDECIVAQLKAQYMIVSEDNSTSVTPSSYTTVRAGMYKLCPARSRTKLSKFFDEIDRNYTATFIGNNVGEQNILIAVWDRSNDERNEKNRTLIKESLISRALDTVHQARITKDTVCISGRVAMVWESLALLDFNEKIGVLKSKQMIRNEILLKSAKIVSEHQDKLKESSPDVFNDYTAGKETKEVTCYKNDLIKEIRNLANDYPESSDIVTVKAAIELCVEVC